MNGFAQDLRLAVRTLRKTPVFATVAVLTLALGIGANTAIFSLLDQVLLRTLPVDDPAQLVIVDAPGPYSGSTENNSDTLTPLSQPMFAGLRDGNTGFSSMLAHYAAPLHLTLSGETESVNGDLVSGSFFAVLGIKAAAGRLITPDDDKTAGAHPVVVLSYGFWKRRFGGATSAIGQSVGVNNTPMTVIGVAALGFHGVDVGSAVDVFLPTMMQPQVIPTWTRGLGDWRMRWLTVMARLRDGVSLAQANATANVTYQQLLQEDLAHLPGASEKLRTSFLKKTLVLLPGGRGTSGLRDQSGTALLVLMGMVGLVLLIACANVANLLLARASARQKEIAVRLALGATRGRLMRQLIAESLLLALLGGGAGVLLASVTDNLLLRALPTDEAQRVLSASPDARVALFTLLVSIATGVVFGLVPAFQSTRPDVFPTLRNEAGAVVGARGPLRLRKGLVVAQVALSLLLLIGAGLLTRSLLNLTTLHPGFEPERLLAFSVDPALNGYPLEKRVALLKQIQDEIAAEPDVRSVSMAEVALMTNSHWSSTVSVEGYEPKEGESMNPDFNGVGPGFFSTLGIPLLAGRDVGDADALDAPKVAVVNEAFARYFFAGKDPIGRRFGIGRSGAQDITIVGLVRETKSGGLREKPLRAAYVPYTQVKNLGEMTFYVRAVVDADSLGPRLRAAVRRADTTLPVVGLKTMRAQILRSLFVDRMVAAFSAAFGALATLLAAIGLYGVMSYAVVQRTREIGIRIALGAERSAVVGMVLKEVALLAAVGVGLGLPSGYGLGRLIETRLFGLQAADPLTFGVATACLTTSALLAGAIPAWRATRVDAMVALRYE